MSMPTRAPISAAACILLAGSGHAVAADVFGPVLELSSLNGANGFVLNGIDADDRSGLSVSNAGDINGDGFDDVIIGAYRADPTGDFSGESYVVFGGPAAGAAGTIELSALSGTDGFVINGAEAFDQSGFSVSAAGDINDDGIDDVIIGAPFADTNGAASGESYVLFGAPGVGAGGSVELASLNGANGFVLRGIDANDFSGDAVSAAGDVNADGVDDLIIGARGASPNANASGEVYVVFGGPAVGAGGTFELSSLNGTNGFVLNGANTFDSSGASVSAAGDVNADGADDLIIGANRADPNGQDSGESYVVFGGPAVGAVGSIELAALDGTNGFVLNGVSASDNSGASVSAAGDVNADGADDLIIGAYRASPNGSSSGESYVIFGGPAVGAGGSIELASLNGTNGFALTGVEANDLSGASVSAAGDVNADGVDDLIIGAPGGDPNGAASGESYVVFGGPAIGAAGTIELSALSGDNGFILHGVASPDSSGASVSTAGDVNGDGADDFIIGANFATPNGASSGASYVVFGRLSNLWNSPAGGEFDDPANWVACAVPTGGVITIESAFGVTINGPAGAVFADAFRLAASTGRTTFNMQAGSLISIEDDFTIPTSAALTGAGTLITEAEFTNNGVIEPTALTCIAAQDITNNADINLANFGPSPTPHQLSVSAALHNEVGARITIRGDATIETTGGVTNSGAMSIAFAQATITGPLTNTGTDDGMGGFDPLGLISISGASQVDITDDLLNQSDIILAADSSLSILGSLTGNGVSGPGAGPAGTVFIEGDFNPGFALSTGIASFDGDLNIGAQSETTISIGGPTAGAQHDQITSASTITAAGDLTIELIGAFTPSRGDTYTIISAPTVNTTFNNFTAPPLANPLVWRLIEEPTEVRLLVTVAADLNNDGAVGAVDIATLLGFWGPCPAAPAPCPADLDADGQVGASDLAQLIGLWGG